MRETLTVRTVRGGALEQWLRTKSVARYDAYHRDESGGRPAAEVFARLRKAASRRVGKAKRAHQSGTL